MKKELLFLTPKNNEFEDLYLEVREKEGWGCSDEKVSKLPSVPLSDIHWNIWKIRKNTAEQFTEYINKKEIKKIIEIGCGNGWFSHFLAIHSKVEVLGIDINESELLQANRVFDHPQLSFAYADVFSIDQSQKANVVVLNGSVQYFKDPEMLVKALKNCLEENGEIHVLDSPVYRTEQESMAAQKRTVDYFNNLGFPEMAKFYYHHTLTKFKDFTVVDAREKSFFEKLLRKKVSPFPWLRFG